MSALAVACPICAARVGARCRNMAGRLRVAHTYRVMVAGETVRNDAAIPGQLVIGGDA